MSKIYIGNLSSTVTEDVLRNLFTENLSLGDNRLEITLKKGYAFVDCQDAEIAQKAVTAFNGYNLMSSIMQVEPAVSRRRKSNRVQLKQLPPHVSKDDVNSLISNYGTVQRFEIVTNSVETIVHITYETPDQAQQAVEQLNNFNFQESSLKAEFMSMGGNGGGRSFRGANGDGRGPRPYGLGAMNGNKHQGAGYPLRILVPSEYVGAIIGRKGAAIREITTQCKARVDVHGKENSGLLEKVISIFGQPENCTSACKEILRVMQQEANTTGKGEIILKVLADDRFCGRIIGKEGKVIKKIREDTNTKITVSNVQEAPAIYPDRVVTIRGTVDNMSAAEAVISSKLRECHERDVQNPNAQGLMLPPNPMMPMMVDGVYGMRPPFGLPNQNYYPGGLYGASGHMQQAAPVSGQPQPEVCSISVPNSAVGALIGSGGVNIKQVIRESGAYVAIEPKKDDDGNAGGERTVTIKGSPEALWKASFMVFDKLKQEGFAGTDDVRLRTSIKVPKTVVGRVIGKSGKNVREIQHTSGAMIKLPESQATQGEEVTVEIFGNFFATQNAQSRIRALVKQSSNGGPNGSGGMRRPRMYDGGAPAGAASAVSAASQIPVV